MSTSTNTLSHTLIPTLNLQTADVFLLQYVTDPMLSAQFYERLFGNAALETSPTFALLALPNGAKLGLWKRDTVIPTAINVSPALPQTELALCVDSPNTVDMHYKHCLAIGAASALAPTHLDFGYACVIQDPDGHRIRIFNPS